MPELTPVRGIITAPQTEPLSGIKTSYGVTVGTTGATERWAYAPTINSPYGGVYDVTTGGVWTRAIDLDASADFNNMPWFQVMEGDSRIGGSTWWYSGVQNPTLGTTTLPFTLRTYGNPELAGTGLEMFNNEMRLIDQGVSAGTYPLPVVSANERGIITDISNMSLEQFVMGHELSWVSNSEIEIKIGTLYVVSPGVVAEYDVLEQPDMPTLAANTWYYVYRFYNTATNYGSDVSTTVPLNAYGITGYPPFSKGTDHTRRYIGAFRTKPGAAQIFNFHWEGNDGSPVVHYLDDTTAAPFEVLTDGRAGSFTTVSCSSVVPPTSRMAYVRMRSPSTQTARFSIPSVSVNANSFTAPADKDTWLPLDSSQQFSYKWDTAPTAGNGLTLQVLGYQDRR